MWTDNASKIDMLFYDPYAEIIAKTAVETDDSSLTIGVFGLWGAGKSTLLNLIGNKYSSDKDIVYLSINAWAFEGYEDAKTAIMEALLRELSETSSLEKNIKKKIISLIKRVDILKLGVNFASSAVPVAASIATGNPLPIMLSLPNSAEKVGDTITAVYNSVQKFKDDYISSDDEPQESTVSNIRKFRMEFQSTIEESNIKRIVILIDDLDRCQPERIIETLEVIKLFLSVSKTTFIIAADENVIQYAIKKKYPKIDNFDIELDKEYIEKMIQLPIYIPQLSNKDIQNYLMLLVMQKYIKSEKFNDIIAWINSSKLMVENEKALIPSDIEEKFNNLLDLVPIDKKNEYDEVMSSILLVREIAATTLKGNPRQAKRFMNTFVIKRELSKLYYGDNLDMKVMAKLLILHKLDSKLFDQLYEWNKYFDTENENYKLMRQALNDDKEDEYSSWKKPQCKKWVECEPIELEKFRLDRYFYLTREILNNHKDIFSDLSENAKKILEQMGNIRKATIQELINAMKNLGSEDLDSVIDVVNSKIEKSQLDTFIYANIYVSFPHYQAQIIDAILNASFAITVPDISFYKTMYNCDKERVHELLNKLQVKGRTNEQAIKNITGITGE